MRTKTLWLIRHGEPDYPDGIPVCMGQTLDYPLGKTGLVQAEELARTFPGKPEAVFSSPRLRALQTAQILAKELDCPLITAEEICELSSGVWEGMSFRQMHEQYPEYFQKGNHLPPPNGETDEEGMNRLRPFLRGIEEAPGSCYAAVGHSGLLRALAAWAAGIPFSEKRSIPFPCCGWIPLRYDGQSWTAEINFPMELS